MTDIRSQIANTLSYKSYLCYFMHWSFSYHDSYVSYKDTVMILSFRTDRSGQTVQTQIRLLLGLHCLQFPLHLLDTLTLKVRPPCSTLRMITANFRVSELLGFLR